MWIVGTPTPVYLQGESVLPNLPFVIVHPIEITNDCRLEKPTTNEVGGGTSYSTISFASRQEHMVHSYTYVANYWVSKVDVGRNPKCESGPWSCLVLVSPFAQRKHYELHILITVTLQFFA